jgi:hypothetical protein
MRLSHLLAANTEAGGLSFAITELHILQPLYC